MLIQPSQPFTGLQPFIDRAAAGRPNPHLRRSVSLWHCERVQDALGQLAGLDGEARRELVRHVRSVRDALAIALEGVDLAIAEAIRDDERPKTRETKRSSSRSKRS